MLYSGTHAYYTRQSSLGVICSRNITIRARELDIWYPQIKKSFTLWNLQYCTIVWRARAHERNLKLNLPHSSLLYFEVVKKDILECASQNALNKVCEFCHLCF
jgi:hypothetical protein